ncbi:glycoside hydrolase family 20 protein [Lepidopterella palustris CBS 459.81]|uniref:Beta-hexosaminidase n=1 Tax=Lepidopterella palustris CBS 459.81 TaxID=1314670 RepID=A0A8E2JEX9_9PEZI|nr:glycoside hydrolase family 20 protein [Lepidopterella palustris CBS 459.81]
MRYIGVLALLTVLASAIWPIPSSYTSGNTILWIGSDVKVLYNGGNEVGSITYQIEPQLCSNNVTTGSHITSQIVQFAIQKTYSTIFEKNFVPWKFHPRNSAFEPSNEKEKQKFITSIKLDQLAADPPNIQRPLAGDVDESYTLSLTEAGEATITANSSIGLVRGLTTFTQLFFKHSKAGVYTTLAPVQISDSPKFPHRGLNMDVSRNYFPVKDIKRTIDAMAYNKFNRLHLHVTDSQSWPLEIPALPLLASQGAYEASLTYTPSDLKELQFYCAVQGIELIVEIDMPGHTASIWFGYPELISAFNIQPNWATYSAEPPSGTLKLNSTAVDHFLETLFKDLLPRVKPYSAYFHTGGDEVNLNAYTLDETVKSKDPAVLQPLMQKFVDRNHNQIRAAGLTPIVWEEMLLTWNLTLGNDVVVQTWMSDQAVADTVAKGHKALVGNYNYWYLDCGHGQWLDFYHSTSSQYYPYTDYCSPLHNWRLMYSYDPLQGIPPSQAHLVLGGEAHIWAEQTDVVNLDRMVWPRACAAAEVLWSGAKDAEGKNRSQVEASPRLGEMRERLVSRGVGAECVQMVFCTQNGTMCAL